MKSKLKSGLFVAVVAMMTAGGFFVSCEEDSNNPSTEYPPNSITGEIIASLDQCHGNMLLVAVENPQGIGSTITRNSDTIKNVIGIPLFVQYGTEGELNYEPEGINLIQYPACPTGGHIVFEYRAATSEDIQIFTPIVFVVCQGIYGHPNVPYFVVTKIVEYQNYKSL